MSSYRATLPVASRRGRAPTKYSTMATDSPLVLIASRPHKFTYTPSLEWSMHKKATCKLALGGNSRRLVHARDRS